MTHLTYSKHVVTAASRSIIITGCARSGTTLIGKILSTASNVEYFFEPESLVSLFAFASSLSDDLYKNFYCSLLVEHLCFGSLAGRNLNFNSNDDSYVGNSKDHLELERRTSKSWRREEVLDILDNIKPVFKIPSILPFIPKNHYANFPESKIVCILRDPSSVYRSIKSKQWFTRRAAVLAPYWGHNQSVPHVSSLAPYWVREKDLRGWITMTETQKFAYYYELIYKSALNTIKNLVLIDYNRLVDNPQKIIDSLFLDLGLKSTPMTDNVLSSVSKRRATSDQFNLEEVATIESVESLYRELLPYSL